MNRCTMYCLLINYRPKQLLFLLTIYRELSLSSVLNLNLNDFLKKFITKFFTSFIIYLRNNSRMPGSMLIVTWVGIIFVIILHRAKARCKIFTNIMPTHVKISIEPGI